MKTDVKNITQLKAIKKKISKAGTVKFHIKKPCFLKVELK